MRMNTINVKAIIFSNHHIKITIAKRVPRMVIGSPRLQYWTNNHVLPISCVWEHHIGSLKRAKVLLISKLCVVTHIGTRDNMNFVPKLIKLCTQIFNIRYKLGLFVLRTQYKQVTKSITFMLSKPEQDLFRN